MYGMAMSCNNRVTVKIIPFFRCEGKTGEESNLVVFRYKAINYINENVWSRALN